MGTPKQYLADQILARLQRKAVILPSRWAEAYRVMTKTFPGPWKFDHHPWARAIHDDKAPVIVGQKAAQMAFSEVAMNRAFFHLDVMGKDVLYLLPNSKPDAGDFSTGRFEPALHASEHLTNLFSDTKNVGMKKAGTAILYIRGSRSDSQLKSIPAGMVIYDEYDEMQDGVRALAQERMSGQQEQSEFLLSTPTIPELGINKEYLASDQKRFVFRCPSCNQMEELTFPESIVITADRFNDPEVADSHLICKNTKRLLHHETKIDWLRGGQWQKMADVQTNVSGYHINQLYSMTASPERFAIAKLRGDVSPAYAQEFAKSKLGEPYVEAGSRITEEELQGSIRDYMQVSSWGGGLVVMGVDIGTRLHYEIIEVHFNSTQPFSNQLVTDVNTRAHTKVLKAGSVIDFEELDMLMRAYHVAHCVVDANPERRKAKEFADRHPSRVSLCFYIAGLSTVNPIHYQPEFNAVKVDRTSWLDLSLSRFRNGSKILPRDISSEYKDHMKSLVRRYVISPINGDISSKYVSTTADHLAHAGNYAEIALNIVASSQHGATQHFG